MRDIDRIDRITQLLAAGWKKFPDLRFGQVIENLKLYMNKTDIFYVEDDEMIKWLEDYFSINPTPIIVRHSDEICPVCGDYHPDGSVCDKCLSQNNMK